MAQQSTTMNSSSSYSTQASPGPSQRKVILEFVADKTKTAKCKICNERVKVSSTKCKLCSVRICSQCSEPDGQNSEQHKAIANDYLTNGCWCGFPSKFNPAFSGRIPPPPKREPVAKKPAAKKRKRSAEEDIALPDNEPVLAREPSILQAEPAAIVDPATELLQMPVESGPSTQHSSSELSSIDESPIISTSDSGHEQPAVQPPPAKRARRSSSSQTKAATASNVAKPGTRNSKTAKQQQEANARKIVIVGAGIIGLFTAWNLAKKAKKNGGGVHTITVIDINDRACKLASGQCSGLITVQDMKDEWLPLVEAAADAWAELRADEEFSQAVAFSENVSTVSPSANSTEDDATAEWVHLPEEHTILSDTEQGCSTLGRVEPAHLRNWLQAQCESLGVKFLFNRSLTEMHKSQIRVRNLSTRAGTTIPCNNLVLACGPFTAPLLEKLLPRESLPNLQNSVQQHSWVRFNTTVDSSVAVTIPEAGVSEDLCGPIAIVARESQGTVRLSCAQPVQEKRRLRVGEALEPQEASQALKGPTSQYLRDDKTISAAGSAFVSTANGHNPVVGQVPGQTGVWLAYGFGNHGTTLAPGVGQLLAEMMMGEDVSTDMQDFAVKELHQPGNVMKA